MKTLTKIFIVFCLMVVASIGFGYFHSPSTNNIATVTNTGSPTTGTPSTSKLVTAATAETTSARVRPAIPNEAIHAANLDRSYRANEVAADHQFKGKRLIVDGKVASIEKDFFEKIVVKLSGSTYAELYAEGIEPDMAAQLKKGQRIGMVCTVDGYLVFSVQLKDCSPIREEDQIPEKLHYLG